MNDTTAGESAHAQEVKRGERFAFGRNWQQFLSHVDEERIATAEASVRDLLGVSTLSGKSFLDIGSGSGLFSLGAKRLHAARVHSFDYDPQSVECTREMRRRYYPDDPTWTIDAASILDGKYVELLGTFDVVYSWGVLHHTGAMWEALESASRAVAPGGLLALAIYNDQGFRSTYWKRIKRIYNHLPRALRGPFAVAILGPREAASCAVMTLTLRPHLYWRSWTRYRSTRGMSRWYDFVDWLGGYPFEVARPEEIFAFYRHRGFDLAHLKTCGGGLGCNEFVFQKR